eukprot:s27_g34.t1
MLLGDVRSCLAKKPSGLVPAVDLAMDAASRRTALAAGLAVATTALLWWKWRSGNQAQGQPSETKGVVNGGPSTPPRPADLSGPSGEGVARPIATGISTKVTEALQPEHLLIHDDSAAHRGHAGVASSQIAETHFRVEVVSSAFEGVSKIQRQRQVQDLLKEEFAAGLHALELTCRTPAEHSKVMSRCP